jgi:hypothetical protein
MDFPSLWEQGLNIGEYIGQMEKFQKEMKSRLRDVWLTPSECQHLRAIDQVRKIFVLSDSLCQDCLMNIPILVKMADCAAKLEYRLFECSKFPDFCEYLISQKMDRVPLFYITDEHFQPVGYWMERPTGAHKMIESWEKGHPEYELLKSTQAKNNAEMDLKLKGLKAAYLEEMWTWYDTGLQSETVKEVMVGLNLPG